MTILRKTIFTSVVQDVRSNKSGGRIFVFDTSTGTVNAGLLHEVKEMLAKEPWLPKRPSKTISGAVKSKNVELVKLLLQHGADPNLDAGFVNIPGPYTPLSEAVIDNDYEIAKILCEAGAQANISGGRNHARDTLQSLGIPAIQRAVSNTLPLTPWPQFEYDIPPANRRADVNRQCMCRRLAHDVATWEDDREVLAVHLLLVPLPNGRRHARRSLLHADE